VKLTVPARSSWATSSGFRISVAKESVMSQEISRLSRAASTRPGPQSSAAITAITRDVEVSMRISCQGQFGVAAPSQ
jgi:hypothetical protein